MTTFRLWLSTNFIALILAFTATGFVFLLAELLLERHWEGVQLIALMAAGLGLVLTLVSLAGQRTIVVAALLLVLSVTGLFGTLEHFEERTDPQGGPPDQAATNAVQVADIPEAAPPSGPESEFDGPPGGGGPPWLAPLSLSGLALLAAAATLAGGPRREAI